ncbi:MAG: NAD-dependent deacetylase [Acidimicrobiia bacterium]
MSAPIDGPTGVSENDLTMVRMFIDEAKAVTILTGAGISTDSGIPDFRGPKGVWTRNPEAEKLSTIQHYLANPEARRLSWRARLDNPAWRADPNPGHLALVRLERRGKLRGLITQNVDGLHGEAGNDPERIFEVHGTMRAAICWECHTKWPMQEILDRVRLGEDDPPCERCGGIVKSDTIMFGQNLVPEVIDGAFDAAGACDLFIAIGTTLAVYPVANCLPVAKRAGARVVIINGEPTEMDGLADVVLRGSISEILPELM